MKWYSYPALIGLAAFACAAACAAQARQNYHAPNAAPQTTTKPAAAVTPQPAPPRTAPSLLTHPAQPAKVQLSEGKLTIQADNSALSEILGQIAHDGGMKIVGLDTGNAAQRIFGSYGPGAPREVLSSLLNGTGYNVLMFGKTAAGVPRELTLSQQPTGGVPNPSATATPQYNTQNNYNYYSRPTPNPNTQVSRPAPPANPPGAQQVRTPQQILQELEKMRRRAPTPSSNNQN